MYYIYKHITSKDNNHKINFGGPLIVTINYNDKHIPVKVLFDSAVERINMISPKLVKTLNLKHNHVGLYNCEFSFFVKNYQNSLLTIEGDNLLCFDLIPKEYDLVFSNSFLKFLYRNGYNIQKFQISLHKELNLVPFESDKENMYLQISFQKLSLFFDTGCYGDFDLLMSKSSAQKLISEGVIKLNGKYKLLDRWSSKIHADEAYTYVVYFVHNKQKYMVTDITILIEDEELGIASWEKKGNIFYDVITSCKFMQKLYQYHNILVCGI